VEGKKMKKIAVIIAILMAMLASGCGVFFTSERVLKEREEIKEKWERQEEELRKTDELLRIYIEERKPPTTVEEAYDTTKYIFDEYSKTEITKSKWIEIQFQKNNGDVGKFGLYLEKINKEYALIVNVGSWCGRQGCYPNYEFDKAIDKNAGEITKKSWSRGLSTWSMNEKQIKTMSTHGADLRFYLDPFPNSGYWDVHVPAVYVQGFLKRVNEYRKYK